MKLTISRLASYAGVNLETVRFYEKIGIMPEPGRTPGGHRVYSDEHRRRLTKRGLRLLTATGEDLTDHSHPAKNAHRQMAGLMAEYEKANTVLRLRAARERVKADRGKCEGRKSHVELRPELVQEARRLARRSPKTGKKRSLRGIAVELAALGYVTGRGRPLSHSTVMRLVA